MISRVLPVLFATIPWLGQGPVAWGQDAGTIAGEVRDQEAGTPLVGAQVWVTGTGIGAVTDADGRFRLSEVPSGRIVLSVQLLGYRTAEARIVVSGPGTHVRDFLLEREYLNLDAIVVTGTAGGAREREVSYSVGRIAASEVSEPVETVDQLLAGRLPGVTVQQGSGLAGSGSQIRLRGNVSLALGNEPLVYLDGVRVRSEGYPKNTPRVGNGLSGPNDTASPLNDLNPADIDRIEIVRGPAATTLYGAEAASGVVQIFTKRGVAGPPSWSAQVHQGLAHVQEFGTERSPYLGIDPWLDDSWIQRYGLSVTGGGGIRYFMSAAYDRSGGLLPNDGEDRFVARANLDFDPLPDLSVRMSASHTVHGIQSTAAGIDANSLFLNVLRGETNFLGDTTRQTLDGLLEYEIETDIDRTLLALTATHVTTPAFTNRVAVGYDRAASRFWQLRPVGYVLAPDGILSDEDWVSSILTAEYVGSLRTSLSPEVGATLSWGSQSVTSELRSEAGYAEGLPTDREPRIEDGELSLTIDTRTRIRTSGVFVEGILGLRERYFVTAGVRADGSTAFGDDLALQTYPRIGGSYVISEEPFWSPGWGRLKLRAVYGHAGRAPGVVDKLRTWRVSDFAGDPAFVPGAVGNPDLAPERTSELEVGLDGAFFGERLTAELTLYDQRTEDALFPVAQIPSDGFLQDQLENVGELRNRGLELSLSGLVVDRPSFALETGFYVYTNRSEVTDLGGAAPLNVDDGAWIMEGEPAPVVLGAVVLNADEVAEPIVELDHVFGPNLPTETLGFSSTVRLPGEVELFARAEYLGGHYLYDNIGNHVARRDRFAPCASAYDALATGSEEQLTAWERVWCIAGNVPRGQGPVYPADHLRFRELTLSKTFAPGFLYGARSRLTLSLRNFWTWTNEDFLVFDPEMSGREGMHAPSRMVDAQIPSPASFVVSLQVDR